MFKLLSLVLSLTLSSTAYAQTTQSNSTNAEPKKVPSVEELSDGIFAFICDEIDNINDVPLIFIDEGETWALTGIPWLAVTKIKDGFILKPSGENESLGVLKEDDDKVWNLEFLSENSSFKTICQSQESFVETLLKAISPKIIENGNSLAKDVLNLKEANSKLETENIDIINEKSAIELALVNARNEINEQVESAWLAAAKREALESLIVKLQNESELNLAEAETLLSKETASKKWWIDLSNSLQAKVNSLNSELSDSKNYTLYKKEKSLKIDLSKSFTEIERQAALIAEANSLLEKEKDISITAQRKLALLNTQTSQLRNQLNELQGLLDESKEADSKAHIQLKSLGKDLNLALARVAAEQRKVAAEQRTNATLTKEIESLKTELHNK
ncbi:hypothetical protein N9296_01980 [Amylibacter sp.]|nr:hypothetical protein [Amylibacter sp.]